MRGTGIICTHVYMYILYVYAGASQVTVMVKNLPASEGDTRDPSWIPGSGRSSGEGHGNLLQYSCLENPMYRGAWRATVHGVPKGQTQQKRLSTHVYVHPGYGHTDDQNTALSLKNSSPHHIPTPQVQDRTSNRPVH